MREPHGESAYPPPSQKTSLQGVPIYFYFQLLFLRQGNPIYFLPSSCFQTRSPRHPNVLLFSFPFQKIRHKCQVSQNPSNNRWQIQNDKHVEHCRLEVVPIPTAAQCNRVRLGRFRKTNIYPLIKLLHSAPR